MKQSKTSCHPMTRFPMFCASAFLSFIRRSCFHAWEDMCHGGHPRLVWPCWRDRAGDGPTAPQRPNTLCFTGSVWTLLMGLGQLMRTLYEVVVYIVYTVIYELLVNYSKTPNSVCSSPETAPRSQARVVYIYCYVFTPSSHQQEHPS